MKVVDYLGFRSAEKTDLDTLADWLLQRALEHDKPTLLFQMAAEKLYLQKIVRPGVTTLERMVVSARQKAHEVTYTTLAPLLSENVVSTLDALLVPDQTTGRTRLSWLRRKAITNSPNSIKTTIEKITLLRELGVSQWDLSLINPNRRKFLAQLGCKSTNQALQRCAEERRYPILIAFLHQILTETIDETVDIFSDCLADADRRSRRDLDNLRAALAQSTNEKLRLFSELGKIVLDSTIPEDQVRTHIYGHVPKEQLEAEVAECSLMVRPHATSAVDFFVGRYNYYRQFAPILFSTFTFHSNQEYIPLLEGISLIRKLNEQGKRKIPPDWYLREETLRPAMAEIVNYHHHLPLSFLWGDGTMSSSDGQRFPVAGKVRNAVALPRYFGYGRGLTFYSWTSNQNNQYGTKVIPSTSRDSTYVLDEILDNETELPILEHTTDTDGYTEIMFANSGESRSQKLRNTD